ncbi:hypothetical protein OCU04_010136 [Sclerotinia nivalis]|uniref:Uncharacterized protein n=1 Tax=Sclerotinia nivalis TaxID=352851 RepID=A0A9X0AET7_9HELO|nr:hypothetical protein OCU04_010136 [Sclerotinia nivalis]
MAGDEGGYWMRIMGLVLSFSVCVHINGAFPYFACVSCHRLNSNACETRDLQDLGMLQHLFGSGRENKRCKLHLMFIRFTCDTPSVTYRLTAFLPDAMCRNHDRDIAIQSCSLLDVILLVKTTSIRLDVSILLRS